MSFSNFSNFARVMHANSFSKNRDSKWRGEDSSGRGCRKMKRLCRTGSGAGDFALVALVGIAIGVATLREAA